MEHCTDPGDSSISTQGRCREDRHEPAMHEIPPQRKGERMPFQIFPDPLEVVLGPDGLLQCILPGKERLPSIVVEPTEVSEVESGELRWPPEHDSEEDEDLFLEQCIPPANIADWGDDDEESFIINNNQPSIFDLESSDRSNTPTAALDSPPAHH